MRENGLKVENMKIAADILRNIENVKTAADRLRNIENMKSASGRLRYIELCLTNARTPSTLLH